MIDSGTLKPLPRKKNIFILKMIDIGIIPYQQFFGQFQHLVLYSHQADIPLAAFPWELPYTNFPCCYHAWTSTKVNLQYV